MSTRTIEIPKRKGFPPIKVAAWRPYMNTGVTNADGSVKLEYFGNHITVQVFSYVGGEHGAAFTTLDAYFCGEKYHATLPQYYHPRWLGRLANAFDWAVYCDAVMEKKIPEWGAK